VPEAVPVDLATARPHTPTLLCRALDHPGTAGLALPMLVVRLDLGALLAPTAVSAAVALAITRRGANACGNRDEPHASQQRVTPLAVPLLDVRSAVLHCPYGCSPRWSAGNTRRALGSRLP